jgi:hypothetical protein
MNFVRIIVRRVISVAVLNSTLRGNHRLHPPGLAIGFGTRKRVKPRVSHQPRGFRVGKEYPGIPSPDQPVMREWQLGSA